MLEQQFSIKMLATDEGACPFEDGYETVKDARTRARIRAQISRIEAGNFGSSRSVGSVNELEMDFGPGYCVYYARSGQQVIVLVGGGDKSTQRKDIERANRLWEAYQDETERLQRDFP